MREVKWSRVEMSGWECSEERWIEVKRGVVRSEEE
jgi:hypothetical protein